ncbi:hypothetical protein ENBRE01_2813 [Enteropsectra breve]|nr:hypothetical protein ENBRE01_2813 [Enteropsectra breve]
MILSDENKKLLVTNEVVCVVRENSTLFFKNTDSAIEGSANLLKNKKFSGKLLQCDDGRIYEYCNETVRSILRDESRSFAMGRVVSFYRHLGQFYFIRTNVNNLVLVNEMNEVLCEFSQFLYFSSGVFYGLSGDRLVKLDVAIGKPEEVSFGSGIKNGSVCGLVGKTTPDGEIMAVSTKDNKIIVKSGDKIFNYHWHSGRILAMEINEDDIISVGADGKIGRFGINLEKKECLFEYKGKYKDIKIHDNKIYLLTSISLIVYDLTTENVVSKEITTGIAKWHKMQLEAEPEEENDIFKLKRKSREEIPNIIGLEYPSLDKMELITEKCAQATGAAITEECPDETHRVEHRINEDYHWGALYGNVFMVRNRNSFSAFYILNQKLNFISGSFIIGCEIRKTGLLFFIYKIYQDRLVFVMKKELKNKDKNLPDNLFWIENRLYIQRSNEIYMVNDMGIQERVYSGNVTDINAEGKSVSVIDDKGVFDIIKKDYVLKQKKVMIYRESLPSAFYIEGKGIYIDSTCREMLLEKDGVSDFVIQNNKIYILHMEENKNYMTVFDIKTKSIVDTKQLEISFSKIMYDDIYISSTGTLIKMESEQ